MQYLQLHLICNQIKRNVINIPFSYLKIISSFLFNDPSWVY